MAFLETSKSTVEETSAAWVFVALADDSGADEELGAGAAEEGAEEETGAVGSVVLGTSFALVGSVSVVEAASAAGAAAGFVASGAAGATVAGAAAGASLTGFFSGSQQQALRLR